MSLRNELALCHHPKPKLLPEPDAAYAPPRFLIRQKLGAFVRGNYGQPGKDGFWELAQGAVEWLAAISGQLISVPRSAILARSLAVSKLEGSQV